MPLDHHARRAAPAVSAAAQHSQSLEAWLAHIARPQGRACRRTPYDVKGLMRRRRPRRQPDRGHAQQAAARHQGRRCPRRCTTIPLGQAARRPRRRRRHRRRRRAAWSSRRSRPPTAWPTRASTSRSSTRARCSRSTSARSSRRSARTNRVLVVHEAVRFGGIGAEIAAQIQEEAFDYLDAPVAAARRAVLAGAVQPGARARLLPDAPDRGRRSPAARAGLTWPWRSCSPSSG